MPLLVVRKFYEISHTVHSIILSMGITVAIAMGHTLTLRMMNNEWSHSKGCLGNESD